MKNYREKIPKKDYKQPADRDFSATANYLICIYHFEGDSYKNIAEIFGRNTQSVQQQITKLQSTGYYSRAIQAFAQKAPAYYRRALKKQKGAAV